MNQNYGWNPPQQNFGPTNGMQNNQPQQNTVMSSNCDFVHVTGPKQVEDYVVRPGQKIYFLDNNVHRMYVKTANDFGLTTTEAFDLQELDWANLINTPTNQNGIDRTEFNALAGDIRGLVDTINGQNEMINFLKGEIESLKVTKSNSYNNNGRKNK